MSVWPFDLQAHPRHPHYVSVYVFDDREEMRAAIQELGEVVPANLSGGCVEVQDSDDPHLVAEVFVSELTVATVTHELAHAAFRVCERLKVDVRHWERRDSGDPEETEATPAEELYCETLEHLHAELWRKVTERHRTGGAQATP